MAIKANAALFLQRPVNLYAVATGAVTDVDDAPDVDVVELTYPSGETTDLEADGWGITALWAVPRLIGSLAASVLYLFVSYDNGTTKRLMLSMDAAAKSISATAKNPEIYFEFLGAKISPTNPLPVMPGDGSGKVRFYVGTSVALAEGWAFHAIYQKLTAADPAP